MRQQFHGLLQCHQDVLIDVGLLHLVQVVIVAGGNVHRVVVHDGHIAEGAHEVEVGHGLPGEAFAHALVLHSLRAGSALDGVVDGVGMANLSPERVGHVHQVLIGAVEREVHIGRGSPVHVTRHHLANLDEGTLEVVPGRVVQVVDAAHAGSVVGVVVLCVVVVFYRTIEKILTRGHAHREEHGGCYIFQILDIHITCPFCFISSFFLHLSSKLERYIQTKGERGG